MTYAERAIAGAITLGLAAVAPTPGAPSPRYVWVAQDAGAPPDASAGDAGNTPSQFAAEVRRALEAYEEARKRREDSGQ